jgi:membrane protease subunit HflK
MTMRYFLYGAIFVFLISLLTGVTQVQPGEKAVVRRFGRVLDEKPGPGLWIGLPWGLDRVDRVPVDLVRRVSVGYEPAEEETEETPPSGQLLTGDHNLVNVQVAILYSVVEDEAANYVVNQERVDGLIGCCAETVLAEWVAGRPVDDVLLNGKAALPEVLVAGVQQRIQRYGLGVRIQDASVVQLVPPQPVKADFDKVNQAQTETRTREETAKQDRTRLLGEARQEKRRLEKEAEAFAWEQTKQARADAANYEKRLRKYQKFKSTNPTYLHDLVVYMVKGIHADMGKNGGRVEPLGKNLGREITVIKDPFKGKKK